MTRLVVNDVADRDIDDILYLRLIQFPESGAPRPKLGDGIRLGVVRPFVILYRYDRASDVVEVLRIVDGRRDIRPSLLPL